MWYSANALKEIYVSRMQTVFWLACSCPLHLQRRVLQLLPDVAEKVRVTPTLATELGEFVRFIVWRIRNDVQAQVGHT
jgi:hypothetical protein